MFMKKLLPRKVLGIGIVIVLLIIGGALYFIYFGGESNLEAMESLREAEIPGKVLVWLEEDKHDEGYGAFFSEGYVYLAVRMGERPTGGYTVILGNAQQEGAQVRITVVCKVPKPWDIVTQVITYPRAVVKLACPEPPSTALFLSPSGSVLAQVEVQNLERE